MDIQRLHALLCDVRDGSLNVEAALEALKELPYHDLGFAKVDTHRQLRMGVPEVIFCQGKTIEQVVKIAERLAQDHHNIMATRASRKIYERMRESIAQV